MELADHHPFRPVDNECSLFRHQGNGAEVDLLLLDISDIGHTGLFPHIIYHQPDGDPNRQFIGHSPVDAFLNAVFHFTESVGYKFQRRAAGKILDGVYGFKYGLQTDFFPFFRGNIDLQKPTV